VENLWISLVVAAGLPQESSEAREWWWVFREASAWFKSETGVSLAYPAATVIVLLVLGWVLPRVRTCPNCQKRYGK
jgi:hypothetical protein